MYFKFRVDGFPHWDSLSFHFILNSAPLCHAVINGFLCFEKHFVKQVETESPSASVVYIFCMCEHESTCVRHSSSSTTQLCVLIDALHMSAQCFSMALRQKGTSLNLLCSPWRLVLWGEIVELNWCGGTTRCRQNTACCVCVVRAVRGKKRVKLWYRSGTWGLLLCAWLTLICWWRRQQCVTQRDLCDQFFIAKQATVWQFVFQSS